MIMIICFYREKSFEMIEYEIYEMLIDSQYYKSCH